MEEIKMFEVGRICVKLAGRDAGKKCIVTKVIDNNYVMIAGDTRKKKCNVKHLEPIDKIVDISENTPDAEIKRALEN